MKHAHAMRQVKNRLLAFFYQKMMDNCHRLIGEDFLHHDRVPKSGSQFMLYIELLELYAKLSRGMRRHGGDFYVSLQERRIKKIMHLADSTIWWHEYFQKNNIRIEDIRSVQDLNRIPPVSRPSLIDIPHANLLVKTTKCKYTYLRQTSGASTGTPFRWLLDERFALVNLPVSHFFKAFQDFGFPVKKYCDRNFFVKLNDPRRIEMDQFATEISLRGDDNDDAKILGVAQALERLGGCVLKTSSSELFSFVQKLHKRDLHPPILFVILVGPKMELGQYIFVKEYLKCPIAAIYGSHEMTCSATGCKDKPGYYHVISERFVHQILDDNGVEVRDGALGNITVTCLDNFLMPLIRYQPGDTGRLHRNPSCFCGNPSPLLEIVGRKTDVIALRNGEIMPVERIFRMLVRPPFLSSIRRCQIRQEAVGSITILLETRKAPGGEEDISEKLRKLVLERYGGLKVIVKEVGAIDQGEVKFNRFVPLQKTQALRVSNQQKAGTP